MVMHRYSLLMWNGDLIGQNPDTMPKHDCKNMPLKELCKVWGQVWGRQDWEGARLGQAMA